jgi:uncharacterized membrane protein YcjF (UPF0283 family)
VSQTPVRVTPRIEIEDPFAPRLTAEALPALVLPREGWGTIGLAAIGASVLVAGLSVLEVANFIADQFARSPWLGWLTLAVAVAGFGLMALAAWRELRFLQRMDGVDRLRADLADPTRAREAAVRWVGTLPSQETLLPSLAATSSPEAIQALLRAGPGAMLAAEAAKLGRAAAVQVLAVTAAVPAPALDGLVVALRGVRLVRQVAELYGLQPGTLGTITLLRRTLLSAVYVGGTNVAVDTLVKAAISNPQMQHLAGDVAGAAVAARRMVVLARATAAACSPIMAE